MDDRLLLEVIRTLSERIHALEVRENLSLLNMQSDWTTFTPTLLQGGVVVPAVVSYCRYKKVGKTVIVSLHLSATAASPNAGNIDIGVAGIPFTPVMYGSYFCVGSALIVDAGVTHHSCSALLINTNTIRFHSGSASNFMGLAPAMTLAASDVVSLTAMWLVL